MWRLTVEIAGREYAVVDRASFLDETKPLELGFRDESDDISHVYLR